MEVLIRFKVESEEDYNNLRDASQLDDETWELYDDESCLIKRDSYKN
jgi:hypothetical protein